MRGLKLKVSIFQTNHSTLTNHKNTYEISGRSKSNFS